MRLIFSGEPNIANRETKRKRDSSSHEKFERGADGDANYRTTSSEKGYGWSHETRRELFSSIFPYSTRDLREWPVANNESWRIMKSDISLTFDLSSFRFTQDSQHNIYFR